MAIKTVVTAVLVCLTLVSCRPAAQTKSPARVVPEYETTAKYEYPYGFVRSAQKGPIPVAQDALQQLVSDKGWVETHVPPYAQSRVTTEALSRARVTAIIPRAVPATGAPGLWADFKRTGEFDVLWGFDDVVNTSGFSIKRVSGDRWEIAEDSGVPGGGLQSAIRNSRIDTSTLDGACILQPSGSGGDVVWLVVHVGANSAVARPVWVNPCLRPSFGGQEIRTGTIYPPSAVTRPWSYGHDGS